MRTRIILRAADMRKTKHLPVIRFGRFVPSRKQEGRTGGDPAGVFSEKRHKKAVALVPRFDQLNMILTGIS